MRFSLGRLFDKDRGAAPRPAAAPEPALAKPLPGEEICLIGDLHGCHDLLERFLAQRARMFPRARAVFLGDMIDRGPQSAAVLRALHAQSLQGAVCLAGNHEEMFLTFLDAPEREGAAWLRHGGFETAQSFGILAPERLDLLALRDQIRAALGPTLEAWLRALPLFWQSGDLVASHAGMDPDLAPADQSRRDLLWGHPDFARRPRADGLWSAHGHVIMPKAFVAARRIALDTGAYASGRLSYALIDPAQPPHERLILASVSRAETKA